MRNDDKKKKKFCFKKIHRRVIALFLAVLSVLSVGIQAAAAFVAAGTVAGIVIAAGIVLVSAGILSQQQVDQMIVSQPHSLTTKALDFLLETPSQHVSDILNSAGKMSDTVSELQKTVDEYFGKRQEITVTPGTGGSGNNNDDKSKIIWGGATITASVLDFIQNSQSHVKQVADGSIDMKGYGALIIQDNHASRFHIITMVWGDYIVVRDARDYAEMVGCKYIKQTQDGSTILDKPFSSISPFALNDAPTTVVMYGDVRYKDGTKADDYTTSVDTKPASIGEVTDADGKPLTDAEGNPYVVNADGTVTVDGQDIPINEDGTVTINGDTYNVTYNLSAYDDTAIIDLLQRILGKLDNSYITEDDTLTEDVPTAVPETITGEGLINASENAINFIPYDGLGSVQAVLETTTFTDKAPEDIVLNLDTVFYKGTWVLIPASIITEWSEAINVIKLFVSTVLLWVFIMWVRRLLFKNLFT